ncbi:GFA family protein [Methylophilus sp. Leaf414]|uniref:GFA family protein n=1 Tax=Methylophilus sp. Leaf414 TaxID=1736371 RepID=UPI0006FE6324|nr:GFA family protein [Methylophilus sp. Leaf414]KQT36848.1 aldehyde-activating protein [Methylophilus sp. Leaf414]
MTQTDDKHQGGCLCEAVRYEIAGTIEKVVYCHCQRCRKASGSAFAAVAPVLQTNFVITRGQQHLKNYRTEAGVNRTFCGLCGSPIIAYRENDPTVVRVRIGSLDTPLEEKVSAHIFVASKAEWHDIHDDAPQYDERPY